MESWKGEFWKPEQNSKAQKLMAQFLKLYAALAGISPSSYLGSLQKNAWCRITLDLIPLKETSLLEGFSGNSSFNGSVEILYVHTKPEPELNGCGLEHGDLTNIFCSGQKLPNRNAIFKYLRTPLSKA